MNTINKFKVSKEISPEGYVKYEYDKFDNVTVTRLGSGKMLLKQYEYDGLGRKVKEYEGNYSESKDKYKSFLILPRINVVKSETDAEGTLRHMSMMCTVILLRKQILTGL